MNANIDFASNETLSHADDAEYDYVIELRADDEYRQAAEALPTIQDFTDIEFGEQGVYAKLYRNQSNTSIDGNGAGEVQETREFMEIDMLQLHDVQLRKVDDISDFPPADLSDLDSINNDDITNTSNEDLSAVVSKEAFQWKMELLRRRKGWVQGAARRSSLGFQDRYLTPDSVARNQFIVALAGGVTVRRHQRNHLAEAVRIFSPDGCNKINWERGEDGKRKMDKAKELFQIGMNVKRLSVQRSSNSVISSLCCLLSGGYSNTADLDTEEAAAEIPDPPRTWHSYFSFQRSGHFQDEDIIAVHPAEREDPTALGHQATDAIRNSLDICNSSLTFSLVIWSSTSLHGYYTLDLECDDLDTYFVLLRGFFLLAEEAAAKRSARDNMSSSEKMRIRFEGAKAVWQTTKAAVLSLAKPPEGEREEELDPILALFQPVKPSLAMSALGTGGSKSSARAWGRDSAVKLKRALSIRRKAQSVPLKHSSVSLPPAQFLGWKSAGTQIWARLKMAGLEVKCVFSWDLRRVILKVRCPQWRLEEVAEHIHLKLKNRDGSLKRFKVSKRDSFAPNGANGTIFRSSERQQIIDFLICSKIKDGGAELDEGTELGQHIAQKFPLHMPDRLNHLRHCWVTFWKQEAADVISEPWSPLSTPLSTTVSRFTSSVSFFCSHLFSQPLDSLADYYGEGVAFYFAYLGYYTRWLIAPSIIGLFVFCFQVRDGQLDHWMCVPYAIYIMLWAAFMLAYWRQYASTLAYKWGVLGFEVEETERPQFVGKYVYDEDTGEIRKEYPMWKRALKYAITVPLLVSTMVIMFITMTTFYSTQTMLYDEYTHGVRLQYFPRLHYLFYGSTGSASMIQQSHTNEAISDVAHTVGNLVFQAASLPIMVIQNATSSQNSTNTDDVGSTFTMSYSQLHDPKFWTVMFLYPCLYGILVDTLSFLFESLAKFSNEFENHRTQTTFLNRLVVKVFTFRVFTVFTTLYYIAFFSSSKTETYIRISVTIFCLMTVGQWWGIFLDICVPSLVHRAKLYHMKQLTHSMSRQIYKAKEYVDLINNPGKGAEGADDSSQVREYNSIIHKREQYLEEARSNCWTQALRKNYTTFQDYTTIIAQLGFILFFSAVFPLAPLIALINNIVLLRLHAYKLCYITQRPIAQKSSGVGVWEDVLQIMSVVGIVTSCGIIGYTSDRVRVYLEAFGTTGLALLLFGLEHAVLLFKYFLHTTIPRIPESVLRAQARGKLETATKGKSARRRTVDVNDHLKLKKRAHGQLGAKSTRSDNGSEGGGSEFIVGADDETEDRQEDVEVYDTPVYLNAVESMFREKDSLQVGLMGGEEDEDGDDEGSLDSFRMTIDIQQGIQLKSPAKPENSRPIKEKIEHKRDSDVSVGGWQDLERFREMDLKSMDIKSSPGHSLQSGRSSHTTSPVVPATASSHLGYTKVSPKSVPAVTVWKEEEDEEDEEENSSVVDDSSDDDDEEDNKYIIRLSGAVPVTRTPSPQRPQTSSSSCRISQPKIQTQESGKATSRPPVVTKSYVPVGRPSIPAKRRDSWSTEFQKKIEVFATHQAESNLKASELLAANTAVRVSTSLLDTSTQPFTPVPIRTHITSPLKSSKAASNDENQAESANREQVRVTEDPAKPVQSEVMAPGSAPLRAPRPQSKRRAVIVTGGDDDEVPIKAPTSRRMKYDDDDNEEEKSPAKLPVVETIVTASTRPMTPPPRSESKSPGMSPLRSALIGGRQRHNAMLAASGQSPCDEKKTTPKKITFVDAKDLSPMRKAASNPFAFVLR